jgi:MFS family permease
VPRTGKTLTRFLADIEPLRESAAFRRLWLGSGVSNVGAWMASFAISLQIWDLTHSSLAVGALGLVQAIPAVLAGMLGGSLADTMDRRRLVLITSSSLAVISGLFALQAFLNLRQLLLLYVLAAVQAVLEVIDSPARRAILPRLVAAEHVPAGVALNQLSFQISLLLGPALGGLLTAAGGLRFCYLVDALSFTAALYGIARLPSLPPQHEGLKPGLAAAVEGFRFIRRQPVLLAAFALDFQAMALGMPRALFPALNAAHFGGRPQTLGLITAATAAGGLIGSVLSGRLSGISRKGRAMLITISLWGVSIAIFGFTHLLWLAVLALVASGILDVASVIFRGTIGQLVTPDAFRGRVTSADYIIGSAGPQLGNFEAGIVASLTTPAISAISGGLATTLGAVLIRLIAPAFAHYKATTTAAQSAGDQAAATSA